jgi:hypothetical protein
MTRLCTAALTVALIAILPATAAADERGTTTIAFDSAKLRASGAHLSATAPARVAGGRVTLPVSGGTVAGIDHDGALTLRDGRRRVAMRSIRVRLGAYSTVSALVGGRRVTLFTATGKPKLDRDALTAAIKDARLTLTRAGGAALGLPAGRIARLTVDADLAVPPVPARPRGAVDLAAATIIWHPRESFVQYIHSGGGTTASRGATSGAPSVLPGSDAPLVYDFTFTATGGWFDPASGRARLTYRGTVHFGYPAHRISIDAKNPEIELDGTRSRAIFRLAGTGAHDHRAVLTDLDPATGTLSPDGRTHTFQQVPARIPRAPGASIFAGYYLPGDPFGWITVNFTTP